MDEKRYWLGCTELLTAFDPAEDPTRALVLKHKALLEEAHRKLLAATGTCPDCYHGMTVDPACPVSDPPHTKDTRRVAPAALCGHCETCIEL